MEKITFSRTDISEDVLLQLAKTSELVKRLNNLSLVNHIQKQEIVKELFGSSGSNPFVGDNFHCDFGKNIHVGDNFHADYNCTMLDVAEIHIGNNCLIGPDIVSNPKVERLMAMEFQLLLAMMFGLVVIP